jgi:Cu-Zn family superoxide dismutase
LSAESALLDADRSALVIHAGADDYLTDPAGNAGDRIACGVITAEPADAQRRSKRKSSP